MKHLHLASTTSTQLYLKENIKELLSKDDEILISAEQQTAGVGRTGKNWEYLKNSLALSFTLKPCEVFTLTSLELGIIIANFLEENYKKELQLKWPNDILLKNRRKCGGIICEYFNPDLILVGIGINVGKFELEVDHSLYDMPIGCIDDKLILTGEEKKDLAFRIYQYIKYNRISITSLKDMWNEKCSHMNQQVKIVNGERNDYGVFSGIDDTGQALVKNKNGSISAFLSGSLFFNIKN